MTQYLVLNLQDAAAHGLLTCACGHPENNHFRTVKRQPCAHCDCKAYRLKCRAGRLIDVPAIIEADLVEAIQHAQATGELR